MRIAVIGAGIAGVATAYELAADGHEVHVFERGGSVAAEGSFANTGIAAPGEVALSVHPQAMKLAGPLGARLRWSLRTRRAMKASPLPERSKALLDLAVFSQERQQTLARQLGLDYEHTQGHLTLLRSPAELAALQPRLELLQQLGVAHQVLSPAQCLRAEPGLNAETKLHAGVLLSQSEVGNCRQFALLLRQEAQRLGARFHFNSSARQIEPGDRPRLLHAPTPTEAHSAMPRDAGETLLPAHDAQEPPPDRYSAIVVCAAADSAALLQPLGLKLPLLSVQGWSVTAPLRQLEAFPDLGPRAALVDARHQVAISRIGQRVRVAGGALLGVPPAHDDGNPRQIELLHKVLNDWFPGATQVQGIQRWRGTRALLPDGLPLLGATAQTGVWLNTAHGSHGWALACGAARALADQLLGHQPSVRIDAMNPTRMR